MRFLRAFLDRVRRRRAGWTPVKRTGLMTDWEFVRASFRQGEPCDPLNATIWED